MHCYIITGTSKGLGEALALELIEPNVHLICISRNKNERLIDIAKNRNCQIDYHVFDLSKADLIDDLLQNIIGSIDAFTVESLTLVNNAGILNPIMPAERCLSTDIIGNFRINALAPIIMSTQFIKQTLKFKCKKMVVNISSGAGKKPYFGWSAYCSSKAAIDMFTKVVGLEQTNGNNRVKIFSFAPGVMDTDMQAQIRESKEEDFESVERFKAFKQDGKLLKPHFVAGKLIELMNKDDLIQGGIYDVKDFC